MEVGLHLLEVLGLFEEVCFERLVYAVILEGGASCGACSVFALVDARLLEEGTSAVALELRGGPPPLPWNLPSYLLNLSSGSV